ncbi:MAG: VCBS repeat-containing protein, partial [Verrucomicrobia bacterium]|nr:VCBS repeat-containing protein [Verrucomicrobiota bacterium]MCG2679711.1 MBG domain-containing protein [Kiritimatiellia bacterium]
FAQASSGLAVTNFAVISGPGEISGLTNLTFTNSGTVSVTADQAGDTNWNSAPAVTNTFNITKAPATVTLNNLTQTYNGSARVVTATTVPSGKAVDITYAGHAWAPTNAGTYAVTGVVNEALYAGSTNGTLTISLLPAPVAQAATFTTVSDFIANWAAVTTATNYFVDVASTNDFSSYLGGFSNFMAGNVLSCTVTGVSMGNTCYYRVRAQNPGMTSSNSGTISVAINGTPALGATTVSNIMATTAYLGGSVTVTNGYPVTERGVCWGTNSGSVLADGIKYSEIGTFGVGVFSFLVTNLPAGRTNYFLAYAVNGAGTNFTGESSLLTCPDAPALLAASNGTVNAFWANWLIAESATNYWLDVAPTNDFAAYLAGYSNRMVGATLTYNVTGLPTRVAYFYRVRSENASGISANSGTQTVSAAAMALSIGSLSYTGMYSGANPAEQIFTITNCGERGLEFTNTTTYSSGAADWWVTTPMTGSVNGLAGMVITGSVNLAGINAGTNFATNTVSSADITNSSKYLVITLVMNKGNQTIINFPNPGPQEMTNRVGLFAQASSGLPVTNFIVLSGPGIIAGLTNLTFTGSGTVSIVASQAGDTNWNSAPSVTNTFDVTAGPVPPAQDGWLAVNVTPAGGSWQLTAPAGYTGQTAGTGNLAAVSAVTGAYVITWGPMNDYVAPSNQSQFVTGGNTTLFASVYLQISTNIGTPRGVTATEGTYTNFIRITWQGVTGATDYEIWRSQTNDPAAAARIADVPVITLKGQSLRPARNASHSDAGGDQRSEVRGKRSAVSGGKSGQDHSSIIPSFQYSSIPLIQSSTYIYDDYAISPILSYYYWVRAKTGTLISPMSYVGMGYAALAPEQATGTADIAASDLVFLPVNMTNASSAGTVSCRVLNYGPDAVNTAAIGFDFHIVSAVAGVADPGAAISDRGYSCPAAAGPGSATSIWIGSAQSNLTLSVGGEELIILTPYAKRGLIARGDLSGVQQVKVTVRHMNTLNDPNLTNNTTTGPGTVLVRASGVNSPGRSLNDYDGDGKSDVALCRADKGVWAAILSGTRGYGTTGIEPETGAGRYWTAAGDYDGDGLLDYGLYEETSGTWWILKSSDGLVLSGEFGGSGFRPVSADYDGDSKSDPAVYGPAWGYWAGLKSASDYALGEAWVGGADYEPVMADYDGDGLADEMAYRASDGHWTGLLSGENYAPVDGYFGGLGFRAGAADFDGDGLADPVVYREADGIWLVLLSSANYLGTIFELGGLGYVAAMGDFDGDGRADPGVYSEQGGAWYGRLSGHDYEWSGARFGGPGYQPVSE